MFFKNLIIRILLVSFLSGCAQNAALLGPAYTLTSTGNIYHAGLTYGSNEIIMKTTGKSTTENLKQMLLPKTEDSEFEKLVKKNIKETRKKLNLPSQ